MRPIYTQEQKLRAVQLYEKLQSARRTIVVLGYPADVSVLRDWIRKYRSNESLSTTFYGRPCKYSQEQQEVAVRHFLATGRSPTVTCRELGYPSIQLLRKWITERNLWRNEQFKNQPSPVPQQERLRVVESMRHSGYTISEQAKKLKVSRQTLYRWEQQYKGRLAGDGMRAKRLKDKVDRILDADNRLSQAMKCIESLDAQVAALSRQSSQLQEDIKKLQMQKDILLQCAKLLKKATGTNPELMRNREKALVIGALKDQYPIKLLCAELCMAKSSYFFQRKSLSLPDKYSNIKAKIKLLFDQNRQCYGYRRIWWLLKRQNCVISEKVVRRLMKEQGLTVFRPRMKKYSSYVGEISPAVPNILRRNFRAPTPNKKWLTDITEFSIPAGKVYLSPIIDCFDGMPVVWKIGTSPSADLANSMLRSALETLNGADKPIIHSDRGGHYRWPEWLEMTKDAGIVRSMSRKGNSADNSACEGFFGTLKCEMFYGKTWAGVSITEFISQLNQYMCWFKNNRIKDCLGGLSPMEYRRSLGYY